MDKDEIDSVIVNIMIEDGPDGHCDGHGIITDFIIAVKEGKEYEWKENYQKDKNIEI